MSDDEAANHELKHIHCHAKNVSRGQRRSSVAAAAYATRSDLTDERTGKRHRYTRKNSDLMGAGLLAPAGAPDWATNRAVFWNRVEAAEKRRDARVAKTVRVAIPREIPPQLWRPLIEGYASMFTDMGVVVDYGIHNDEPGDNPHCHFVISTRPLEGEGFAAHKLQMLNRKKFIYEARKLFASYCNKFLEELGSNVRYTADSYKKLGIDRTPTRHRGKQHQLPQQLLEQPIHIPGKERLPMAKKVYQERPDFVDIMRYPNLTRRPDWPPAEREPLPEMTQEERRELGRYFDLKGKHDHKQQELQDKALSRQIQQNAPGWFDIKPKPEPDRKRAQVPAKTQDERFQEEITREHVLREEQEQERLNRNPVHVWLENERSPALQRYEYERASQQQETMQERRMLREARRSGDPQAIDLAEIEVQERRIARLREEDNTRLQNDEMGREAQATIDRIAGSRPEEEQRLKQARNESPEKERAVSAELFRSRLNEYEQFKQAQHDRLENNPREREEHERLERKARKMLPSRDDMQRLRQSWDVAVYTFDRRPVEMTYQQIIHERMERVRAKEQEQAREQDRRERERDERERIQGR